MLPSEIPTTKQSPILQPLVGPILQVTTETPQTKAFTLSAPTIAQTATPGQFMMVWIPKTDEIPMSISSVDVEKGHVEFAAAQVGDATTKLHQLQKGDLLGLRGPLGKGFILPKKADKKPLLLVAGGCGSPPILFAAQVAVQKGFEIHIVVGATTKTELLFQKRFKQLAEKFIIATDDGSAGIHGTSVDATTVQLKTNTTYAACLACGPEGMLINLNKLVNKYQIPLQVSLERYMKCGVGLCGHCIIDHRGTRVCYEGPVFDAQHLKDTDFGKWKRNGTGKREPINPNDEICPT